MGNEERGTCQKCKLVCEFWYLCGCGPLCRNCTPYDVSQFALAASKRFICPACKADVEYRFQPRRGYVF